MESTVSRDRISELPEEVLHLILSFQDIKQVVQATTLSRNWRSVWSKSQTLEFVFEKLHGEMWLIEAREKKAEEFIDLVERTLTDHLEQMVPVTKLSIDLPGYMPELTSTVDRWIDYALKSYVQHLEICITYHYGFFVNDLHPAVLRAKSIQTLSLNSCFFKLPFGYRVNLCNLKELSLHRVYPDDGLMQNIISGCPLLENMSIVECCGFKKLHLFDLCRLRKFNLIQYRQLEKVEIEAPNVVILSIRMKLAYLLSSPFINVIFCKKLTDVCIGGEVITNKFLSCYLSKLPTLKLLKLEACNLQNRTIKISSSSLHKLFITGCAKLAGLEIDAPYLQQLSYSGDLIPFLSSSDLERVHVSLELFLNEDRMTNQVIEFISQFSGCSCTSQLTLRCETFKAITITSPEALTEMVSPLTCNFKDVHVTCNLYGGITEGTLPVKLLDSILGIAPHIEHLLVEYFFRLECSFEFKFMYRNEGCRFCCSSTPSCCIKNVEIIKSCYLDDVLSYLFEDNIWENMKVALESSEN